MVAAVLTTTLVRVVAVVPTVLAAAEVDAPLKGTCV